MPPGHYKQVLLAIRIMQSYVMLISSKVRGRKSLQESAVSLFLFHATAVSLTRWPSLGFLLLIAFVVCDDCVDSFGEDVVNPAHFFTAALHIAGTHLSRNGHSLLLSDRGQSLGFEEVDTGSFCSKIRLEADEDERSIWAEMENFGVPLEPYVSTRSSTHQERSSYLVHNIFKGVWAIDGKADKQEICLRV